MSKNHYDLIVVGGGLTGTWIAYNAAQSNLRVALVEAHREIGGISAPIPTEDRPLPATFGRFPASEESQSLLDRFEKDLGLPLNLEKMSQETQTFENAKTTPFLGFGERRFKTATELSTWNQKEWLVPSQSPEDWLNHFRQKDAGEWLTQNEVTEIQTDDAQITGLNVNGRKVLTADRYAICLAPPQLAEFLPVQNLGQRTFQKLAKSVSRTAAQIHLRHAQTQCEDFNFRLLMSSKDEDEPVLGRFFPPHPETGEQDSLWISLVEEERAIDTEHLGHVLRFMKKQIKRPFPEAFKDLAYEKIVIHSDWCGSTKVELNNQLQLKGLSNAHFAHRMFTSWMDPWLGSLAAARGFIEKVLEGHPNVLPTSPNRVRAENH